MSIKIYNKTIALVSSGVLAFSMCGCSQKKNDNNSSSDNVFSESSIVTAPVTDFISGTTEVVTTVSPVTTTVPVSSTTEYVSKTEPIVTTSFEVTTEPVVTSELLTTAIPITTIQQSDNFYTPDDQSVLDYFHELGDNVKNSIDTDEFLEKGKMYFIYCVDFLFYDGEIKGVKFGDMTDIARQQLLSDISFIDSLICSKFPNYKETISDGAGSLYNKASEIIKAGSQNIKDFSREKLGDENYYKLEQYKDLFVEQTASDFKDFVDILGVGKSKLNDWYNSFKGQN